jgi:hypothetical protein
VSRQAGDVVLLAAGGPLEASIGVTNVANISGQQNTLGVLATGVSKLAERDSG